MVRLPVLEIGLPVVLPLVFVGAIPTWFCEQVCVVVLTCALRAEQILPMSPVAVSGIVSVEFCWKLSEMSPFPFKANCGNGWLSQLVAERRNCSFCLSLIWKFLNTARSLLK